MNEIKNILKNLTSHPGIYQMLDEEGKILYIGKASNLKKRVTSYFSSKQQTPKTQALLKHVKDIQVTVTHNENEALLLECNLIKKHKPHYNILFRDDKSFPYIFISHEKPYPSMDVYRGNKKKAGHYFGPYPNALAVRETLNLIQKIFKLRIAKDRYDPKRKRPCLRYQIGLCSGSCASLISEKDYQQDVAHTILFLQGKNEKILNDLNAHMESASKNQQYEAAAHYRDQIAYLREIQARQYITSQSGDYDVIGLAVQGAACIQLLLIRGGRMLGSRAYFPNLPEGIASEKEVLHSFMTQHYLHQAFNADLIPKNIIIPFRFEEQSLIEKILSEHSQHKVNLLTAIKGEKKQWITIANTSAQQSIASYLLKKSHIQERFIGLQDLLKLSSCERIECFDISHSLGEATVASCVVFTKVGPLKTDYRRFNIKDITPGDDTAAMSQVVFRRYQYAQKDKMPDVILIDGGKTQLAAAQKALDKLGIHSIQLIAVAKGAGRKPGLETLYLPDALPIHLKPDSIVLHFIQQVRDEAHRFAISGHRQQRDKKRRTSILEHISGIGQKRSQELLLYFGGMQSIKGASSEELAKVPGISLSLAKRIFTALHSYE